MRGGLKMVILLRAFDSLFHPPHRYLLLPSRISGAQKLLIQSSKVFPFETSRLRVRNGSYAFEQ